MKKQLLITMAALSLCLGACGSPSETQSTKAAQETQAEKETVEANAVETETPTEKETEADKDIPKEYKSALNKAKMYSETMHMSKAGLYDQLTSEYGEQFSEEAAQYAIDNIDADWKENALAKAKEYQDTMDMSPEAIRDQLVSEYGEKFTQEEADYAVEHLE